MARQAAAPAAPNHGAGGDAPAPVQGDKGLRTTAPVGFKTGTSNGVPIPVQGEQGLRSVAPAAPKTGGQSDLPAAAQGDKPPRRRDEITRKVPNPLLHQQKPSTAPTVPPRLDPKPPITTKLKNASQAWDEFNAMPVTPPPAFDAHAARTVSIPVNGGQAKKGRGVMFASLSVVAIAGAVGGVLFFREAPAPQTKRLPEREPSAPVVAAPEKPSTIAPKAPIAAAEIPPAPPAPPAPSAPAKRHVSISVEPAEATLVLDGNAAVSGSISTDLAQDRASHVVQATAPGYIALKKSFTLESDVSLRISLKKAPAPAPVRGGHAKVRAPEPAPTPAPTSKPMEAEVNPKPAVEPRPKAEPSEDYGMDLNRPAKKRQVMKMDEKDPYVP
jgi:hypothetical protein